MATTKATKAKATKSATKTATSAKSSKATASAAKSTNGAAKTAAAAVTRRPKMHPDTREQLAKGKTLTIEVAATTKIDSLVKELNRRLVIDPGIINPKGCAPCHSGLDMVVIKNKAINVIR